MNTDIKDNVAILQKASEKYYNGVDSELSDEEFDLRVEQLQKLDPDNPFLLTVGAKPIGTVVEHTTPIGSQEKLKTRKEFDDWCGKILNNQVYNPFVLQYKLDGCTIVLYYEDGNLKRAVTRGDGYSGEDITSNVLQMQNVKKKLPIKWTGSLRGEIMLHIKSFNEHFKPIGYKNPRNTVSGMSRDQKENNLFKHFRIYYFDVMDGETFEKEYDIVDEHGRIKFITKTLGLEAVHTEFCTTPDEVWTGYEEIQKSRETLDFEIDGVIVRANSLAVQKEMGVSSDLRPKGQRCIKFPPLGAVTTLKIVHLTIGHTGAIIPNGILEPVNIGGVTVTNVLLNNFEEIERLKLKINGRVKIIRAGDVIPKAIMYCGDIFRCPECGFTGTEQEQQNHHKDI